jgi:prolyl-tRNA synthetase
MAMKDLGLAVGRELDALQALLFERARARVRASTVRVDSWKQFEEVFADQGSAFACAHWDGTSETELAIKDATKATIRCLPLAGEVAEIDPMEKGRCVRTGNPSAGRVLFAKNY